MGSTLFAFQFLAVMIAFATLATSSFSFPSTKHHRNRMVTKLIHTDSIFSPYHNPNDTIEDRANRLLNSSKARLAYLQNKFRAVSEPDDSDPEVELVPAMMGGTYGVGFLANISVGKPPIPQLLMIDTGSSLTWVASAICEGCSKEKLGPVYDNGNSSTYAELFCLNDNFCRPFFSGNSYCNKDEFSEFELLYGDGTNLRGFLAAEQLMFETSDEGTYMVVSDVVLGCPYNASTPVVRGLDVQGILGLGSQIESIVHQLNYSSKFSYCIGNISDPSYSFNMLALGGDAWPGNGSYSTYLEMSKGQYFLILRSISSGGKTFAVDLGRILIDSGTTFSYLPDNVYFRVKDVVSSIFDGSFTRVTYTGNYSWILCYEGYMDQAFLSMRLDITFHFVEDANLVLGVGNLFYPLKENVFCLGMVPSSNLNRDDGLSIIGIMAQQHYNIGYDLSGKRVHFEGTDCQYLW